MRTKDAITMFAGAWIIYTVMAACSASSGTKFAAEAQGTEATDSGSGGNGGAGGSPVNLEAGAPKEAGLLDSLIDPVPDAKADTPVSGSRLKAKYRVGEDGSRQFLGWFDSQLQIDCEFGKTNDGIERCFPTAESAMSNQLLYSDSKCSIPVVLRFCVTSSNYVTVIDTKSVGSCSVTQTKSVVQPTQKANLENVGKAYRLSSDKSICDVGADWTADPDAWVVYEYTQVPDSTFVSATIQVDK